MPFSSLTELLQTQAARRGTRPAILGVNDEALTYVDLLRRVAGLAEFLRQAGVMPGQTVAVVMENGADLAVAVLAAASTGVAAPLNPRALPELRDDLTSLRAVAMIVDGASSAAVTEVAIPLGLRIIPVASAGEGETDLPARDGSEVGLVLRTSGTTARPKVVPLTHASLCLSAANVSRSLALTGSDRCLNVMPLFHIHGIVAGLLATLASGGSLVATPGFRPDDARDWLSRLRPTWYTAVPTIHQAMLAAMGAPGEPPAHSLRLIRSSSAPLPAMVMERLEARFGVPVLEAYGMTEAAHQMATNPLPPARRVPGTVGTAAGPEIAIWDGHQVTKSPGVTGEVVVNGPNVMTGYLDNPEANASAFVEGWFRTGDEGVLDAAGYLRLTGRLKEMINRGGEKIAPQEVDEALLDHPDVVEAITFGVPHPTLGEEVAAALVVRRGVEVQVSDLVAFAAARLAPHKVPRRFKFLNELPKGPTGKPVRIGMAALLGMDVPQAARGAASTTDATGLAGTWGEVLEIDSVPEDVDFFALGGDSLRAVRLLSLVHHRLEVEVPLQLFVEGPVSLGSMRRWLEGAAAAAPVREIEPADGDRGDHEVSFAENGIVFLSRLDPAGALYNTPTAMRIRGKLDVPGLEAALGDVWRQQPALRTSFPIEDGRVRREVREDALVKLLQLQADGDLQRQLVTATREPFDLEHGPLARAVLFEEPADSHVLLLVVHHVIFDGWSADVLWHDLLAAYAQRLQGRAPEPIPTAVTNLGVRAAQQRQALESRASRTQRRYWLGLFSDLPEPLDLPLDRRHPAQASWRGARYPVSLDEVLSERVRAFARERRSTVFSVLLATLDALLSRLCQTDDVVVGAPVANRLTVRTAGTIGLLVNTLALRVDTSGDPTFEALVERARETTVAAWANQDYPFERLVEDLRPRRDVNLNPLFRVMLQVRRPSALARLEGLAIEPVTVDPGTSKLDLAVDLTDHPGGIAGWIEYNTDVLDEASVHTVWDRLRQILDTAVANPTTSLGRLPLLLEPELEDLRAAPRVDLATAIPVHQLFEQQAARSPLAMAAICGEESVTYSHLDQLADRLAERLVRDGLEVGDRAGVSMRRTIPMLAAVLAVLKCGAAYVPLDPAYPEARLALMTRRSDLRLVVVDEAGRAALDPAMQTVDGDAEMLRDRETGGSSVAVDSVAIGFGPEAIAYVLFTSGSTGEPNGVAVTHAAVHNLLRWGARAFSTAERARVLASTSLNFDLSVFEMFLPLTTGGAVVLVPDVLALHELPATTGITLVNSVPAAIGELAAAGLIPASVRVVCSAGEALSRDVANRVISLPSRPRLVNLYGPTETTVYCTMAEVGEGIDAPTIGRAIDGARLLVLDGDGRPLPAGVAGELHVGGAGLAAGYLDDPGLTQERFVDRVVEGVGPIRLYRTGDRVRLRNDGEVEYLGRTDDQLKVLGFRIEPAEVEAVLRRHPSVANAAVVAPSDRPGELAAFVEAAGSPATAGELREFAGKYLPHQMVPTRITWVPRLPRTLNGKVDRKRLATERGDDGVTSRHDGTSPAPGVESTLAGIWNRLLERAEVGTEDDFFELGGHSLLALRMVDEAEKTLGKRIPLSRLFDGPATISRLAAVIGAEGDAQVERSTAPATIIRFADDAGSSPLFFLHGFEAGILAMRHLPPVLAGHPLAAVVAPWRDGDDIASVSARAVAAIRQVQPNGPYVLVGHSLGGIVAYDVAAELAASGQVVELLCLVDTATPARLRRFDAHPLAARLSELRSGGPGWLLPRALKAARLEFGALRRGRVAPIPLHGVSESWSDPRDPIHAMMAYSPRHYNGRFVVLATRRSQAKYRSSSLGWADEDMGSVETRVVRGNHATILSAPHNVELGAAITEVLTELSETEGLR